MSHFRIADDDEIKALGYLSPDERYRKVLVGPGRWTCVLGEPEDCTWSRDGRPAVDMLNEQAAEIARLTAELTEEQASRASLDENFKAVCAQRDTTSRLNESFRRKLAEAKRLGMEACALANSSRSMGGVRADITSDEAAELREFGKMRRAVDVADLRILARHRVDSDALPGERRISAFPGQPLAVTLNDHGAVCAVLGPRSRLGIKPREFDFVCPLAEGRTYLDGHWRIDVAPEQLIRSPDGERWRVASVYLVRAVTGGWGWVVEATAYHPHQDHAS